ncbi:MAG: von Willebrand factor, type [Chthonomonadaceae bacterium]|nr:von Willebrand factor, type [Chthonomonadaceae bacterium]
MFEMDLAWDRAARSGPQPTTHILRVRLRPLAENTAPTALPLRLAIALDTSGSMAGAKLESAKAACRAALALLRPEDRFSLAAFGDHLLPLLHSVQGGEAEAGEEAFATLQPLGVTRTDLALDWLARALPPEPNTMRIALLITDGHPTDPQGHPTPRAVPLLAQATDLADRGITLYTAGLGNAADFHAGFLAELSDRGRGAFLYADTPQALEPQMRARLNRAQSIAVADSELQLTALVPGLRIENACRLRPEFLPLSLPARAEQTELALPALAGDAPTDLLLSVTVPPPAFGESLGLRDVLDVRLRMGDTSVCSTAALISTASYREAQQLTEEVDQDRLSWELNTYSTALTRTSDTQRTSALLSDIAYTARRTGRSELAHQAAQELDSLQRTGTLDPHASASLLTSTRELGGH